MQLIRHLMNIYCKQGEPQKHHQHEGPHGFLGGFVHITPGGVILGVGLFHLSGDGPYMSTYIPATSSPCIYHISTWSLWSFGSGIYVWRLAPPAQLRSAEWWGHVPAPSFPQMRQSLYTKPRDNFTQASKFRVSDM